MIVLTSKCVSRTPFYHDDTHAVAAGNNNRGSFQIISQLITVKTEISYYSVPVIFKTLVL